MIANRRALARPWGSRRAVLAVLAFDRDARAGRRLGARMEQARGRFSAI